MPNEQDYQKMLNGTDFDKIKSALDRAHDIRKFEIELYWKRTNYFALFIGATATAYGLLLTNDNGNDYPLLTFAVACLGMVFSWGWFLVNKGSKYWQENWEYHIDCLETDPTGPIHKVIFAKESPKFFTGAGPLSVSKVNQLISFIVFLFWFGVAFYSLLCVIENMEGAVWSWIKSLPKICVFIIFASGSAFMCWGLWRLGRSQHTIKNRSPWLKKKERTVISVE